jgi:hypothetical protein
VITPGHATTYVVIFALLLSSAACGRTDLVFITGNADGDTGSIEVVDESGPGDDDLPATVGQARLRDRMLQRDRPKR